MADTQVQSGVDFGTAGPGLLRSLANNWWLLLLRGMAAIAFGVLAFFWPGLTLITLTLLWGAYALVDGVIAIWAAFNASGGDAGPRWWLGLSGVVSILAGIVTFYYTGMTTLVLLMFIAVWAIIIGAMQIWGAIALRKALQHEWLLILKRRAVDRLRRHHDGAAGRWRTGLRLDDRLVCNRLRIPLYRARVQAEAVQATVLTWLRTRPHPRALQSVPRGRKSRAVLATADRVIE
jgi:uncharacterized membrane protein HdeD (DUF308 family)